MSLKKTINMEQPTAKIIMLKEDLVQILDNIPGSRPDIMQFCTDHSEPLLTYDKKPVLKITQDELLGVFDSGPNHLFLRAEQIIRLAGFLKIRLPNTLALVLKAEWEYFCCEVSLFQKSRGMMLEALLIRASQHEDLMSGFQPDTGQIYKQIKTVHFDEEEKVDYGIVDLIIKELVETQYFLGANSSMDQLYPVHAFSERIMLERSNDQDKETFLRLKDLWTLRSSKLDDYLPYLEKKKQKNLNDEEDYLRNFARELNKKSDLIYDDEKYRIILGLISDYPGLSLRALINLAEERMVNQKKKRIELRKKFMRSSFLIDLPRNGDSQSGVSDSFRKKYEDKCNALIRKIKKLLHTDKTRHLKNFSKRKEEEAIDLWMELMQATSDEKIFSFSPTMLLYMLPDYDQLLSIYHRACKIVGEDPEDFEIGNRLEFMIRNGRSICEVIEFLEDELQKLEYQLGYLELKQFDYFGEQFVCNFIQK